MFRKQLIGLAIIGLLFVASRAGAGEGGKSSFNLREQGSKGFSLLDPQRLSLTQSYGLYFSTGKGSRNFALYQNSIRYKLAEPLILSMDLGYLHRPLRGDLRRGFFLSHLGIDYRPNPYFNLQINISRSPWAAPPFRGER